MSRTTGILAVPTCVAMLVSAALNPPVVRGDAIVVTKAMSASTIAEVFVEDDSIRIELEIGPVDIVAFKNLLPDEILAQFAFDSPGTCEERRARFFSQDMPVRVDGRPLPGEVLELTARKRIRRDEVTGKPFALQPPDGELVVYARLRYKFEGQPKSVSLRPTIDQEHDRVTANIGFITYHRGLPVMDFRYLSTEETLDLDWQDPWYSRFRNNNLRRQFDAPLSTFLYVEPFEVRVEIVVRPVDLQRWTELGVSADQIISVSKQKELKSRVASFLQEHFDVTINGKAAKGKFDRIHFISRSLRKTGVIYPDQDLHASSATLGVIFVYPIEQLPDHVTMRWGLFDERISKVPAVATDEAGGLPSTLSANDPILEWKNFLTNPTVPAMLAIGPPPTPPQITLPMVSICLLVLGGTALLVWMISNSKKRMALAVISIVSLVAAAACWPLARTQFNNPLVNVVRISDDSAQAVTQSLLHNLYHSFDRKDESIVYDRLATCVSGDLLREIYLQILRRIQLEDQGGAQVKIDTVAIKSNEIKFPDESGFQSTVTWNVAGTVGHWGHLHTRANQYVADFIVKPVDGAWKITSMQVIDEVDLGTGSTN